MGAHHQSAQQALLVHGLQRRRSCAARHGRRRTRLGHRYRRLLEVGDVGPLSPSTHNCQLLFFVCSGCLRRPVGSTHSSPAGAVYAWTGYKVRPSHSHPAPRRHVSPCPPLRRISGHEHASILVRPHMRRHCVFSRVTLPLLMRTLFPADPLRGFEGIRSVAGPMGR